MSDTTTSSPATGASSLKTNVSLAAMMFLQYMLFAVWFVQLAHYLRGVVGDGMVIVSCTMSTMAIGSMASPVVCALAGRYLAAQKVLALANLLTAAFLFSAGYFAENSIVLLVLILFAMICYMPTWALTSSIAMSHSNPENFPRIRTFGTIGWVASGLFGLVAVGLTIDLPKFLYSTFGATSLQIWSGLTEKFDGTNLPLYCGAGIAIVAAVLNLTLPNTPPSGSGRKFSISEALGLKAFALLRDKNYRIFIIGSFITMVAFVLYFNYGSIFIADKDFKNTTFTQNWGQFGEMFFMFLTTTVLAKIGVKKALLIGILAMTARYLSFYLGDENNIEALYILGILFHGLIFGWFFAGGQVYTYRKAPKEIRGQAQGMFAFIIWGLAVLAGTLLYGYLIDLATTRTIIETTTGAGVATKGKISWGSLFLGTTILSFVSFLFFLLFFKDEKNESQA